MCGLKFILESVYYMTFWYFEYKNNRKINNNHIF